MNCYDLIARHENLKMQVQKMRVDIQNITTSHQKDLKTRNIQNGTCYPSLELNPLTNSSRNIKPETSGGHFRKGMKFRSSPCSVASEQPPSEKRLEEEEEEELQQVITELKKKLSLQVQPGYPSEELMLRAEHLCKSFSNLMTQVASPARKTEVGGNSLSGLS